MDMVNQTLCQKTTLLNKASIAPTIMCKPPPPLLTFTHSAMYDHSKLFFIRTKALSTMPKSMCMSVSLPVLYSRWQVSVSKMYPVSQREQRTVGAVFQSHSAQWAIDPVRPEVHAGNNIYIQLLLSY